MKLNTTGRLYGGIFILSLIVLSGSCDSDKIKGQVINVQGNGVDSVLVEVEGFEETR